MLHYKQGWEGRNRKSVEKVGKRPNTALITTNHFDASYSPSTINFGHKWTVENGGLLSTKNAENAQNAVALCSPAFGHREYQQLKLHIRWRADSKRFDVERASSSEMKRNYPMVVEWASIDENDGESQRKGKRGVNSSGAESIWSALLTRFV